jgi:secretion/DNA translocation related TadE-like protein
VLAFVAVLVAAVGGAVADQRRLESAADLAALAAAGALQAGTADPCVEARSTGRRNGATVVSCRVAGVDEVVLRAERRTRPVLGRSLALSAWARAGPVPSR